MLNHRGIPTCPDCGMELPVTRYGEERCASCDRRAGHAGYVELVRTVLAAGGRVRKSVAPGRVVLVNARNTETWGMPAEVMIAFPAYKVAAR